MGAIAQTLREQFRFTDWAVNLVLGDTTDEVAVRRARSGKGASVSWAIGHLLSYRVQMLNLLGTAKDNPWVVFTKEAADDGSSYPAIGELLETWNSLGAELTASLEAASDEQLLAALPTEEGPHAEKKVLDTMVFFAWHEAHHMGAISMIRIEAGRKATATLAMEQRSE